MTSPVTSFRARVARRHTPTAPRRVWSARDAAARLPGREDIESTPWRLIGCHEMNLLRSRLAEHCAPATANEALCIVGSVLGQTWSWR